MSEWHIPDELIRRFATDPGEVGEVTAASIEQHLTACRTCQAGLAQLSSRSELDLVWAEVADRTDRAGSGFSERLLHRLGIESASARLLAATAALRAGAILAVSFIVAAVVFVSRAADTGDVFLVLAPIVPTGLVALSFAPGADPAGECGLATPMFGFRLLVRRVFAVEAVALLVLAIGSLFVPIDGLRALGWLLPSLALSLGTLAGAARWSAPDVSAGVMTAWITAVLLASSAEEGSAIGESVVFDPAGQIVLALMAVGAAVSIALNRQTLLQEVKS